MTTTTPTNTRSQGGASEQVYWHNPENGHVWSDVDVRYHCKNTTGWTRIVIPAAPASAQEAPAGWMMKRIDAAANALSEVMASTKLTESLATKVERALSGLRAMQANEAFSAAVQQGESPSEKQQKLMELADRIDHEELWRWAGMDHHKMTPEQQDRMNAGVALRRYARLWAPGRWLIFPPVGPVNFSASTLDKVYVMAKKDEDRAALASAQPKTGVQANCREQFEAYARRAGYDVRHPVVDDNRSYISANTCEAWTFWQESRRLSPGVAFASWCIDLLQKAEAMGLYLDEDKKAILLEARRIETANRNSV